MTPSFAFFFIFRCPKGGAKYLRERRSPCVPPRLDHWYKGKITPLLWVCCRYWGNFPAGPVESAPMTAIKYLYSVLTVQLTTTMKQNTVFNDINTMAQKPRLATHVHLMLGTTSAQHCLNITGCTTNINLEGIPFCAG